MKHKTRLTYLLFVLSVITFLSVVYAWYIVLLQSNPIIIPSGTLKLEATFYQANDDNLDGLLDGGYTVIDEGNLIIGTLVPGQIYTFRMEITNIGTVDGQLSIFIRDVVASNVVLWNELEVTFVDPITEETETLDIASASTTLIPNYLLESMDTLVFDFTIRVKESLGNDASLATLTIGYFEVRLDQIVE